MAKSSKIDFQDTKEREGSGLQFVRSFEDINDDKEEMIYEIFHKDTGGGGVNWLCKKK